MKLKMIDKNLSFKPVLQILLTYKMVNFMASIYLKQAIQKDIVKIKYVILNTSSQSGLFKYLLVYTVYNVHCTIVHTVINAH